MTDTPDRPGPPADTPAPAADTPVPPDPAAGEPTQQLPLADAVVPPVTPGAGLPGEPPPGGTPPPLVPTPGGPMPPEPPNWPMRILIALLAALVVLVAVIAGALIFGGDDDEPVAATTVPTTVPATTLAPTTTGEPTTTTEATTTTTVAETTTTTVAETTTTTEATTTTSTTTTLAATTTAASECAGLDDLQGPIANFVFLDVDGIGTLTEFGDRDEDVITTLTCLLGEPDEDTGYGDSFSVFGTCPGTVVRGVRWGPLLTLFGDTEAFGSEDREFYNWRYDAFEFEDELGLTFPETGLGLGTTVAELEAEYGDDVEIFDDERTGEGAFVIGERDVANTTVPEIFGTLTGTGADGQVQFIDSGLFCGE